MTGARRVQPGRGADARDGLWGAEIDHDAAPDDSRWWSIPAEPAGRSAEIDHEVFCVPHLMVNLGQSLTSTGAR